jgi:hypothetical protein
MVWNNHRSRLTQEPPLFINHHTTDLFSHFPSLNDSSETIQKDVTTNHKPFQRDYEQFLPNNPAFSEWSGNNS